MSSRTVCHTIRRTDHPVDLLFQFFGLTETDVIVRPMRS
ncbi:hypothetical protein [Enterobacter phage 04_vB_Eclo_IJM]|nr:hypothetical protein [Enterobacter phage 04_vB_Eclo_IJM]